MNILYLNNTMNFGGGVQKCIVQLNKKFNNHGNTVISASSGGEYAEELDRYGIRHYNIINPENKGIVSMIRNLIKIRQIVKDNKIEIIHSHHRMTTFYAKIISKTIKVKVIHTAHAFSFDKKILGQLTLRNIDIIAISNGVKKNLIEQYGIDYNRIKIVYNAIEFTDKNEEICEEIINAKKEGYFIVGAISRLEEVKGIDVLMKAAKEIIKYKYKIKFFILGDGKLREEYTDFINDNNLSDYIFILGRKKNVISYIKSFDVLVQPSISEGLGLVAIESISQGTPVIASDIEGLNEVVKNNVNGILFEVRNVNLLVMEIINLYKDDNKRKILGDGGIEYYNKFFKSEIYYESHECIYKGEEL